MTGEHSASVDVNGLAVVVSARNPETVRRIVAALSDRQRRRMQQLDLFGSPAPPTDAP